MFKKHVYHKTLEKCITLFGQTFTDLEVRRETKEGKGRTIPVEVHYAPQMHYAQKTDIEDRLKGKDTKVSFPMIAFMMTGLNYTPSLQRPRNEYFCQEFNNDGMSKQFVGTPYTLDFELQIHTRFQTDTFQIIEQILPYFAPDITYTQESVSEFGLHDDVTIVLNSISIDDNYQDQFDVQRRIVSTLTFGMQTYFYSHTRFIPYIKNIQVDFQNYKLNGDLYRFARNTTTIDPRSAGKDDDYDVVNTEEEFFDGLLFNPQTGQDE